MQSFDTNYPPSSKQSCRPLIWLAFGILSIALIVATVFAVLGALKSSPDQGSDECPARSVVWQDEACCRKSCKKNWNTLPLLLISLDGFRYDYLQRNKTPSLKRLIECGVHAPFMFPSYPTKTFPNHYSIVTGLYPESHGIVDNQMYDPTIDPANETYFTLSAPSARNPQWWKDMTPTYHARYDKKVPFFQRVDQVVDWLLLPDDQRPEFVTMYLSQPDADGHQYGPESPQVTNTLLDVDAQISYLLGRLYRNDILHCLNLVILADHGMQQILTGIPLDPYLQQDGLAIFGGPIARISVNESGANPEAIRDSLTCKNPQFRVYTKGNMPRRTHYFKNPRIGDVILDGDLGVEIAMNSTLASWTIGGGDHGYDNRFDSMHALFLAWGPNYKKDYTVRPFQNVELYNFFSDTINIENRAPNNGTPGSLDEIFVNLPKRSQSRSGPEKCQKNQVTCGTCSATDTSTNQWTDTPEFFGPSNSTRPVCYGEISDSLVLYDHHFQLPVAVFEIPPSNGNLPDSPLGPKSTNSCTQITYAQADCEKVLSVESELSRDHMDMYSLRTGWSSPEGDMAWEFKTAMHNEFYSGVWRNVENLTLNYTGRFGRLVVASGPIFDVNNDGLGDDDVSASSTRREPVATHYYRILIRCTREWTVPFVTPWDSCPGEHDTISFIVPHAPTPENCMDPLDYLREHLGRIRDIELLTGLELFQGGLTDDAFHKSALLRTRINDELW